MKNALYSLLSLVLFMACQRGLGRATNSGDRARQFAEARFDGSDYAGAVADYTDLLRQDPQHPDARYNRGAAYFKLQKFRQALTDFDHLLVQKPTLVAAYDYRARVRYALHDDEGARADLRQARTLSPPSANYTPNP